MKVQLSPLLLEDFRISVVLPVFSETRTVREIIEWLSTYLEPWLVEVIIVISPRSSAESQEICRQLAQADWRVRVFQQEENPGVGRAFREGYRRVQGNVVLSMDSDGEMELATIPRMIAEMASGSYGLVTGSRWLPGGGFVGYSPAKRWLNWGFQQLFRTLFWTQLHDLTYGFKLMRSELVRGITWEAIYQDIGCETTLKALWLGVPASEVATTWRARTEGRSTNNFWRNFRYVGMAIKVLTRGVAFDANPGRAPMVRVEHSAAAPVTPHRQFSGRSSEGVLD